jgi:hypothetical protein
MDTEDVYYIDCVNILNLLQKYAKTYNVDATGNLNYDHISNLIKHLNEIKDDEFDSGTIVKKFRNRRYKNTTT